MTRRRRAPLHSRPTPLIVAIGLVASLATVITVNASADPPDPRASDLRVLAYEALKSDPAQTHYARGQTFREMAHLVTLSNNALSGPGEATALNESTSDIFGAMAEFFTNNPEDPPDFVLGEGLEGDSQEKLLTRFMDQPSKDGRSPDCFSSDVGQLEPHDAGGVSNHFFFLLANGSGESEFGNSPTCDNSQVKGIGRDSAEQIWFRAVTTYFTSDTGFQDARKGSLQAAADLFGQDSTEAQTVAKAWDAVNVKERAEWG
jgi:Zn-dependent metalloprotease